MYWYLAITITILIATQVVRVVQNAKNLRYQNQIIERQLQGIEDVTNEDLQRQKRVFQMAEEYLNRKLGNYGGFSDDTIDHFVEKEPNDG